MHANEKLMYRGNVSTQFIHMYRQWCNTFVSLTSCNILENCIRLHAIYILKKCIFHNISYIRLNEVVYVYVYCIHRTSRDHSHRFISNKLSNI